MKYTHGIKWTARNEEAKKVLADTVPQVAAFPQEMVGKVGHQTLRELSHMPFMPISGEVLDELDVKLKKVSMMLEKDKSHMWIAQPYGFFGDTLKN